MRPVLIEPLTPVESGLANLLAIIREALASLPSDHHDTPAPLLPPGPLSLAPGGYVYRDVHVPLAGAPLAVLAAFLAGRHRCITAEHVEREILKDSVADDLRQRARDAVQILRASLRGATGNPTPILTIGRGRDLAWKLLV